MLGVWFLVCGRKEKLASGHTSVSFIQGTPPGVRGRPLYAVLKDDNFGLLLGTQMQLGVWSKGNNSLWLG